MKIGGTWGTRSVALAAMVALSGCVHQMQAMSQAVQAAKPLAPVAPSALLPVPQWTVGDTWTYSDGYALQVTSVPSLGVAAFQRLDDDGQWFVRRGFFREDAQSAKVRRKVVYRTDDPMRLFAARINEPVTYIREYLRDGELVRHRTSWVIEGKEIVAVPAGTFETWVVVMRTESLDSNWRAFERWYYNPEVRNYVRMEFKYGENPDGSRVLMSYQLAKAPS